MPRSDWRLVTVAGIVLAALLALVIGATLHQFHKNRADADKAAAGYRYYTHVQPDCTALATLEAQVDCFTTQEAAAQQEHYNQGDLSAQKDMATWTFGLFWIAVLGFVPGVIGIAFLYANLIGLERQSDATRLIGQEQTKAYLAPATARLKWEKGDQPWLDVTYRNGGQTPAVNLREVICFHLDPRPADFAKVEGVPRPLVAGNDAEEYGGYVDRLKLIESVDEDDRGLTFVWVYIFYNDVFGRHYRSGTQFAGRNIEPGCDEELFVYIQNSEPMFEELPLSATMRGASTYFSLLHVPVDRPPFWARRRGKKG